MDLARQVLCNAFGDAAAVSGAAFSRYAAQGVNTTASVAATTAALTTLISDLDAVLASDANYLLGTWIADARRWGNSSDTQANLEMNARNQVRVMLACARHGLQCLSAGLPLPFNTTVLAEAPLVSATAN